jgi:hypothetical protein
VPPAFSTSNRTSFDRFVLEMRIGCCKGGCLEGKTETELTRILTVVYGFYFVGDYYYLLDWNNSGIRCRSSSGTFLVQLRNI